MNKPNVKIQGKAVVDVDVDGQCLVMLPDGSVFASGNRQRAEKRIKEWFAKTVGENIGVGSIEWRTK